MEFSYTTSRHIHKGLHIPLEWHLFIHVHYCSRKRNQPRCLPTCRDNENVVHTHNGILVRYKKSEIKKFSRKGAELENINPGPEWQTLHMLTLSSEFLDLCGQFGVSVKVRKPERAHEMERGLALKGKRIEKHMCYENGCEMVPQAGGIGRRKVGIGKRKVTKTVCACARACMHVCVWKTPFMEPTSFKLI